ncbi:MULTISPECIES: hypothetical protein [unclassified Rhizobium]|uniref:hypothetical protein n=1 Tax=unclassified Rhizobium TaxID=2613769 RepID=UPI001146930E|nr:MULTISPECIES: hypothetical protein [unclassified Rhizobium]MDM9621915.1 hypothetical protein [Rhizobium sp. S96]
MISTTNGRTGFFIKTDLYGYEFDSRLVEAIEHRSKLGILFMQLLGQLAPQVHDFLVQLRHFLDEAPVSCWRLRLFTLTDWNSAFDGFSRSEGLRLVALPNACSLRWLCRCAIGGRQLAHGPLLRSLPCHDLLRRRDRFPTRILANAAMRHLPGGGTDAVYATRLGDIVGRFRRVDRVSWNRFPIGRAVIRVILPKVVGPLFAGRQLSKEFPG